MMFFFAGKRVRWPLCGCLIGITRENGQDRGRKQLVPGHEYGQEPELNSHDQMIACYRSKFRLSCAFPVFLVLPEFTLKFRMQSINRNADESGR